MRRARSFSTGNAQADLALEEIQRMTLAYPREFELDAQAFNKFVTNISEQLTLLPPGDSVRLFAIDAFTAGAHLTGPAHSANFGTSDLPGSGPFWIAIHD